MGFEGSWEEKTIGRGVCERDIYVYMRAAGGGVKWGCSKQVVHFSPIVPRALILQLDKYSDLSVI